MQDLLYIQQQDLYCAYGCRLGLESASLVDFFVNVVRSIFLFRSPYIQHRSLHGLHCGGFGIMHGFGVRPCLVWGR